MTTYATRTGPGRGPSRAPSRHAEEHGYSEVSLKRLAERVSARLAISPVLAEGMLMMEAEDDPTIIPSERVDATHVLRAAMALRRSDPTIGMRTEQRAEPEQDSSRGTLVQNGSVDALGRPVGSAFTDCTWERAEDPIAARTAEFNLRLAAIGQAQREADAAREGQIDPLFLRPSDGRPL